MGPPDNVIQWLLEEDNPPVRYLTLTELLKKPEDSPEVSQARLRLMTYSVTEGILKHHVEFWQYDDRSYWKYTGKYWQLIFLGQFRADGYDPRIAQGVDGILRRRKWINSAGGQCLTANILRALMLLGYGDHPVVIEETEALAERLLLDGGIKCEAMGYSLLSRCYMALPKLLLCFTQVPEKKRSSAINEAMAFIVREMLENEVYQYVPGNRRKWQKVLDHAPKRRDLSEGQTVKNWIQGEKEKFLLLEGIGRREAKKGWLQFGFPLHYNSDILEAMYALTQAGVSKSAHMEKPLQVIRDKMTKTMQWKSGEFLKR